MVVRVVVVAAVSGVVGAVILSRIVVRFVQYVDLQQYAMAKRHLIYQLSLVAKHGSILRLPHATNPRLLTTS